MGGITPCVSNISTERDEEHFVDRIGRRKKLPHLAHRNLAGLGDWIAVNAAADRRKRDRARAMLDRELQAVAITRCEQLRLTVVAAAPDRTDGVDHMLCRQPVPARDLRLAGLASAEETAFRDELRSRRAMNRAVDTTAAEERTVRGVDDRIDREF